MLHSSTGVGSVTLTARVATPPLAICRLDEEALTRMSPEGDTMRTSIEASPSPPKLCTGVSQVTTAEEAHAPSEGTRDWCRA